MMAINPSELPIPGSLKPLNQVEANHSVSNPLASFAQKSLDEYVGVGFFISAEGHILTNAGMVSDCQSIASSHGRHTEELGVDKTSDLALLLSSQKPDGWASFQGASDPRVADTVMAIGFPTGTISALEQRMMRISNPIQLDNSGSPLLDRSGNVVGIVARRLNPIQIADTTSGISENINFAVSLKTIKSFLDSHAVPYVLKDSIEMKSYSDIAAEAMRYTVLLECIR